MSNETRGRNRAQDIASAAERPALQWANGRTEARRASGRFAPLVGWHVEVGRCAALDAMAAELAFERVTIRHQREGAAPALVEHWYLGERVVVYPLTYGPLATTLSGAVQIADRMADEAGIVATWVERSYLGMLVLVEPVPGVVCEEPLVLSARSTMTTWLYEAILAHLRICEAADAVAGVEVPCAWIGLPLAAGDEYAAGKGAQTTVVSVRAAYEAGDVDAAYLKVISLPKAMRGYARDLTADSLVWARETLDKQLAREQQAA